MNALDRGYPMFEVERVITAYVKIRRVARRLLLAEMPQSHEMTRVRRELMFLMRHMGGLSMESIGALMGGRHPSTIWAGLAKVADRIGRDPDYRDYMAGLVELIAAQIEAEDVAGIKGGIAHVL